MKVVILVGAGSTLSDASNKPLKSKPPLDAGFFTGCKALNYSELQSIKRYLKNNYDIDPTSQEHDSLEKIMAIIYADINNPVLQENAVEAFRGVIRLFNRRIAQTTNNLGISNQSNLFRLIGKKLIEGVKPTDISIITFNQDIQIEKTLEKLNKTKKYSKFGNLFSFPNCYRIKDAYSRRTSPSKTKKNLFDTEDSDEKGIPIYKLHGSLNWYSNHRSMKVPKAAILNKTKKFSITSRKNIAVNMTYSAKGKRKLYTFPLIIPPVNHKAAIIHNDLHPIWKDAEKKLEDADEIIIFGYSCPSTDFESANMIRRATNTGTNPKSFVVIDPSPNTFHRYIEITALDHLSFFKNCDAYIKKG